MYNTLAKCGMKIPREVAISSPRSGGEAIVGAVKQLSNDSENLTRRHTGETLGLAAIPPPFQLLAVGALPGRPYDRSAIAQQCSAAPLGCEASKFSAAYLCCKFPATFGHNSRCGSTLRNWGRSEMMVTQLVFVSFPQFRYITDDDDATRSASN